MSLTSLLIANRGEIAVRIARTARELGVRCVAVYSEDDAQSAHPGFADASHALVGRGARAYLSIEAIIGAALATGCDAVHPGYGFLSESAAFSAACAEADLVFVGPGPETLSLFGDKPAARTLAMQAGVAVLAGTEGACGPDEARALLHSLGPNGAIMLKAVAGGGGRGMRKVTSPDELAEAYERCRSEALASFGSGEVYAEAYLQQARHLEVQVIGDSFGAVRVLGDRDCSIQRRHQKLLEFGPAPFVADATRRELAAAAVRLATATGLRGLATVEFLCPIVDESSPVLPVFIEANPRIQVEHTVTEAVTGLDLVALQLAVAGGASLTDVLPEVIESRGMAVQARICAERYEPDGTPHLCSGRITGWQLPHGPGIRVDTAAGPGYEPNPAFDSLVAKLVLHTPLEDLGALVRKARGALGEIHIDGLESNAAVLGRILGHASVVSGPVSTAMLADHPELLAPSPAPVVDPLAVLRAAPVGTVPAKETEVAQGHLGLRSPVPGTVVRVGGALGENCASGTAVLVIESMKMEHVLELRTPAMIVDLFVAVGDTVRAGELLAVVEPTGGGATASDSVAAIDLDELRPDLAEVVERHGFGLDAQRPEAVAKRRATGQRTARENIAQLVDEGTFVEYAPLVVAAQRRRRSLDDLIRRTPGDGLVGGIGRINGDRFGDDAGRAVIVTYDFTVLAGTQGLQNHRKKDRLFELAEELRLPVVLFAEGGGGRPGDTDGIGVAGLDCLAFHLFGRLSGVAPLVGITSGYCFAGNAALLGTCDVVIATKGSNIGMGGPAMIEGGGLGVFHPSEIGPVAEQFANGVVDLLVEDEDEAVRVAQQYLGYFQGRHHDWSCADQRELRRVVPEQRLRVYDVRAVLRTMFDDDSVLELRRGFGAGMITALARIEGRPVGVIANDPSHLGGAIDADAADKSSRFMKLCDAFDLPLVFLCDTPGFMVGPPAEREALVRKAARLFVTSGSLTVPFMTIVLRKGYGLGAQAMAGGSFRAPLFTISWPTGEFGGMGLEGAVKLGYRKELEAIADPTERKAAYDEMVARMYEHGKALNAASLFEIDEVIDPAASRHWISTMLAAAPSLPRRTTKKREVDTW